MNREESNITFQVLSAVAVWSEEADDKVTWSPSDLLLDRESEV